MRSSEGKTAQTLAAAFEAASAYAPAVLLLRRFGALVSSAAHGVPDANASGAKAAPLLARALERCIRQHSGGGEGGGGAASDDSDEEGYEPPRPEAQPADEDAEGQAGKARLWHRAPRAAPGCATVLLLAAVEAADALPPDVRRCFTHEEEVLPPDEPTRTALLKARPQAPLRRQPTR